MQFSGENIKTFAAKWHISNMALFGSVAKGTEGPHSDVDIMVEFVAGNQVSFFDMVAMRSELENIFNRKVDLLTRHSVENSANPFRRNAILNSAKVIYAA